MSLACDLLAIFAGSVETCREMGAAVQCGEDARNASALVSQDLSKKIRKRMNKTKYFRLRLYDELS